MKKRILPEYGVEKIGEGVYKIDEFGADMIYLVVGEKSTLVVDAGTGIADLVAEIRKITDLPLTLVGTHGHTDHIGGKGQFEEVYLHKDDVRRFTKAICTRFVRKLFLIAMPHVRKLGFKTKDITKAKYKTKYVPIDDGYTFDLGGKTAEVRHFPGHTFGSVVILLHEDKIMFTGDNINPMLWMWLPCAASLEEWMQGAKAILELAEEYTPYCGHDGGTQSTQQMMQDINWIAEIINKRKRNTILYSAKGYPKMSSQCIVYRTDNVFIKRKRKRQLEKKKQS